MWGEPRLALKPKKKKGDPNFESPELRRPRIRRKLIKLRKDNAPAQPKVEVRRESSDQVERLEFREQ